MCATDYTAPQFPLRALLTIDARRDVLDGQPLEVPGTSATIPNVRALVQVCPSGAKRSWIGVCVMRSDLLES
jgi:hypothetical protein